MMVFAHSWSISRAVQDMKKGVLVKPDATNVITDQEARDVVTANSDCMLLVKYFGYDTLPARGAVFNHDEQPKPGATNSTTE